MILCISDILSLLCYIVDAQEWNFAIIVIFIRGSRSTSSLSFYEQRFQPIPADWLLVKYLFTNRTRKGLVILNMLSLYTSLQEIKFRLTEKLQAE